MGPWDMLVAKTDLADARIVPAPEAPLGEGQARLAVERFALTANNVTYALIGDAFGYWRFFPAPEGMGRIPAWGFARVIESRSPDAPVGLRLFGYFPMSTHVVMDLRRTSAGLVDAAPHRAELPPTYNAYAEAPEDALDDHRALLRPLLMTSFLLDDFLGEAGGLASLVLSSASSKTAMGLAWFARARGLEVVGLSSPANATQLGSLGLYDRVLTYGEAGAVSCRGPAAYVDFAGDAAVTATVHGALGDRLVRSVIVGGTHWQAPRASEPPPGPAPALFFAPDQIRKRMADWGPGELDRRFADALRAFVADAGWLRLVRHQGSEGLLNAYAEVLEGRARPQDGHIIQPA